PGDPPRDIQVLSIDSRDVIIVWKAPKYPNMKIEVSIPILSSYRFKRSSLPTDQLKPSYDYYVKVRAINEAGAGPLSEAIHFTTPNGGPENPPTGVTVDINEANIAVSYVIYFTRDLGLSNEDYKEWQTVEVPATQTRYKFGYQVGLKPKTFYRVRVSAKNDVAEGPVSETKEFETAYSELPIPTDIKTRVAEDNSLTITFTAVRDPDDHSNIIQRYKIELARSDDVLTARWFPVNASTISIDEITSEKYIVYYATRDAADLSDWDKIETESTEIIVEEISPDTRYLIRVQAATADGPGIISDAVECFSDRRYQPIEMDLVSIDVPNLEAEPNQTVTFRCSAK
ncbi:fibronectin type III domain protein, partial [Teladorsagia circumcincta]